MTRREFPYCCAIDILTGFGNTVTALDTTKYTKEDVIKFLDSQYSGTRLTLIALNEPQIETLGLEIFKERGYEVIKQFYYEGHGNNIYLLGKHNGSIKSEQRVNN